MKDKSIESAIPPKDYEKQIEEYNSRDFDSVLKEFSDCPLNITSYGKKRYPLSMCIETPQGNIELFFDDPYASDACFIPRQSS